ncbi:alpha-hydroxy-acid oxidizing protein [Sphingomonas sp. Leaf25]|uniref:alpha-hydroxy-acid oxidizing protein n=1 Tax=Sphingomonas sp. Leaf25 TaxID=1735692 RepID=UPI001F1C20A8|nr:alpha-hydroxy-acid oxidizing protein [Sphingomonas sp. Leaf25]
MEFTWTWSRLRVFLVGPGYALAAAGEQSVSHKLQLVEAEVRVAMALTSCRSVRDREKHLGRLRSIMSSGWRTNRVYPR